MYKIFDITLDCDMSLPELPKTSKVASTISIRKGVLQNRDWFDNLVWFHHWYEEDESICISAARCNDGYVLRFPELADFIITFSNPTIEYYAENTIPLESIRHVLLDQVIPRMLGQQGRLILHGSAVLLPGSEKSVVFIGESGSGKSTLASSFYEEGSKLLTDDCLLIEICNGEVFCLPNYFGLRLYDDSVTEIFKDKEQSKQVAHYSDKKRLLIESKEGDYNSADKIEIGTVFILGENSIKKVDCKKISIKSITGAEDFMKLITQIFIIDVSQPGLYGKLFKEIGKIVSNNTPIFYLDYPHDYSLLSSVKRQIKDNVHES